MNIREVVGSVQRHRSSAYGASVEFRLRRLSGAHRPFLADRECVLWVEAVRKLYDTIHIAAQNENFSFFSRSVRPQAPKIGGVLEPLRVFTQPRP